MPEDAGRERTDHERRVPRGVQHRLIVEGVETALRKLMSASGPCFVFILIEKVVLGR